MIYPSWPKVALNIGVMLAVLAFLWFVHSDGFDRGASSVQAKWDAETIRLEAAARKAEKDARDREQQLQAQADQRLKDAQIENSRLNDRVRDLALSLRNRAARPAPGSELPQAPGVESAKCTGSGLYRDDAEFLVGLARDADQTRNALNQCVEQYNSLR